ncbi:MAG: DsbA family protein [Rhodospirillaceae bacterium]|nr:DsbA family protein [Rhodospirillaceae bacterium]
MKFSWSFAAFVLALAAILTEPTVAQDKASAVKAASEKTTPEKSAFTPAQREELKVLFRDYLIKNPEVLAEAIQALQAKEEAAKEERREATIAMFKDALYNPKEQTILGNLQGDITIVEFFDYNCGYCKSMFNDLISTIKSDGKIKLVLKELPILGPNSVTATKAALASRNQRKYPEFHQALISYKGPVNEAAITAVAKGVGLNVEKLLEDMKDPAFDDIIEKNRDLAQAMDVTGTPALLVGGTFVGGAIGKDKLKNLIADARKQKS